MISNLQGGDAQGASTLTQQFVKITLQENALKQRRQGGRPGRRRPRRYTRKLQELKYAITLEKKLTKDQILQGYLNLVYYGDQAYGVEAAAQHYFGTTRSKLTPRPGRTAGRPRAAAERRPTRCTTPRRAQARRNVVLDRMQCSAWSPTRTSPPPRTSRSRR